VAGGLEVLLGCDVIVASRDARFGLPEVKRGLFAGGNGTTLGARIPLAVALELALTGDLVDAERALALGLVNAVVDPDDVVETAVGYAERIAANAPLALAATKELVRLAATDGARYRERRDHWRPVVFGSQDAVEGATAFVEKRDRRAGRVAERRADGAPPSAPSSGHRRSCGSRTCRPHRWATGRCASPWTWPR
jgi:enoyl-CoA hydratase/carnithine racemase